MKAFLITDQKQFMKQLLKSEVFDHFLLSEAQICGNVSYEIDGHINPDFYGSEDLSASGLDGLDYLPFGRLRPICFELIKGKHTPLSMKFVFLLTPTQLKDALEKSQTGFTVADINAAFLNITFKDGRMTVTSGCSYRTFTMDHSFDHYFDELVFQFLMRCDICFDVL